ncbi:GNAT family N-acetyltransferase [Candidatus Deferrimicrobium sp.]|uniref:GNAT family N-acetyltransferase n=1 Tax=Candidatus Deferrimicrobium sp. TaxID=3060586 RepID=UPI003C4E7D67
MQPIVDTAEVSPSRQLHPRRSSGNPFLLRDNGLELRLATSRSERAEAQRLRFEVFNLELQLGLTSSLAIGLDQDVHDGHCDHLLVIDTDRDCLVGTYRLLSFDRVPSFGFYSESEFDLTNVKRSGLRLLELGRSCVALEYRDGRAISLLFRGIAEYLRRTNADALMGCASIHGTDLPELATIQEMLSQRFLSDPSLRVTPRRGFDIPPLPRIARVDEPSAFRSLPPLFRGYLRTGAKVCGPPAYDRQFGTTDFFVLAKTRDIAGRYNRRFLG